jgi:sortase A
MGERLEPRRGTDRGHSGAGGKRKVGIAGHRDGFFRNLKEISRGDVIEIETTSASEIYVVDSILVAGPDEPRSTVANAGYVLSIPLRGTGPALVR